ncbi:MAG: hypothetical protein N2321_05500 [Melioribacteraceae bacterium]|nr:hypothetical protein [Melioribacteraceae bacterium]
MLERITNISAGSDYKNATSKMGKYNRTSQFLHTLNNSISDSISLSPAVSYLNSINWKLKKINKVKENLVVIFEFDGFEFTANVGFPELALSNHVEYYVRKNFENVSNRIEVNINLETPPLNSELLKEPKDVELYYFNSFINDLIDLKEKVYELNEDNFEVIKLFKAKEKNLKKEFDAINENLFHFIEKYLSIKLRVISNAEPVDDKIVLRKVQIIKI